MKQINLIKTLIDVGLSENEAKVYLAMLSLGQTTILQISRKVNIKRPTVYTIIESLKSKGLVVTQAYGFKRRFLAEEPDKLGEIINYKKDKLLKSLPMLFALKKLIAEEEISKHYEGLPAIKYLYDSLLNRLEENDDYLIIGNQEVWYSLDPILFHDFMEREVQIAMAKNINIKILLQDSELARNRKERDNLPPESIKILPKKVSIDSNLVITPRQLVIHQMKGKEVAIVIENPSIIETHKQIFKVLWEMC